MQTADFNHNDFNSNAQNSLDEQLLVKFFIKQVEDKAATLKEGRPIFKDVEYVDIKVPGNRTGGACRPAQFRDKQRFPRHYEAFKNRIEAPIDGTPLAEWPLITRSQAEEFAYFNVKTVEQLIAMPDSSSGKFMGMNNLKRKAEEWLAASKDSARANEIEELKAAVNDKNSLISTLEAKLSELSEKVEAINSQSIVSMAAAETSDKPSKKTTKNKG